MVTFGSGYQSPMDRGYDIAHDHAGTSGHSHSHSHSHSDVGVSIGDLGMSLGLGPVPNVSAIAAKLRPGGKKLEFVFTGTGKGSGQGQTPGMYGEKQRKALREVGRANRVDFTTHSTVGVYGLAGMDQQGNFSKQSKDYSLQEVKRAIEFAADVARGGPVVVHTGEFQRPVADQDWNKQGKWANKFKLYEGEDERFAYRVVDTRTGNVIQEARKNRKVARPVWNVADAKKGYKDDQGNWRKVAQVGKDGTPYDENGMIIYTDYFDKRINSEDRAPQYDKEHGKFKVRQMEWEDLEKEAKDMTLRARQQWKSWKRGDLLDKDYKESRWARFAEVDSVDDIKVRAEEAYIIATLETNAANSRGWAHYYGGSFQENIDNVEKLKKAKEAYKKIEKAAGEEKEFLKREFRHAFGDLIPADKKLPSEIIDKLIRDEMRQITYSKESSASQWAQAHESMETMRHVESAETYAIKEAAESYARLGIDAMRRTNDLKKKGLSKKPLQVAMENLFPEQYGAHPLELVNLVKKSRKKMVNMLTSQSNISKEEAAKRASDHLTITFDTGHLNMWRKYWKGDPNKSIKQNDEEFNKWSLDMVKKMAPYIGHVHIDDNYGYHDDHLAPGEGNTPIRAMIKTLKENGYEGEMIVEPGADYTTDVTGFHSVMKTWRHFGLPVYGASSGISRGRTWNQVGYGFFGQNQPPYFTFGGYSPSEDWTLWSGVPLE